ncbi:hypothetical protein Taro_018219 [Colocasia esculenta]|uniref:Uncharacterized protein n=1 Tax=Colocasia esculenta TaxID=4460 RepID=A0A843UQ69_COLES|nr:hypothetical protein [Colocasia esculenta]
MALSRYAPYVASDNDMMVEYFIRGLRVELQNAVILLMCKTIEEAAQRAATLVRSIRTRHAGESGSGSSRLPQQSIGVTKGKAPVGPSSSSFEVEEEVASSSSRAMATGQRWKNLSRVLLGSLYFHQVIDVIIVISRGV